MVRPGSNPDYVAMKAMVKLLKSGYRIRQLWSRIGCDYCTVQEFKVASV